MLRSFPGIAILVALAAVLAAALWLAWPASDDPGPVADAPHADDAGEAELAGRAGEPVPAPPETGAEEPPEGEMSEEEMLEALLGAGAWPPKPPAEGVRVTGRVLLASTDAPVAGATVMTWTATKRERTCEAAVTDAEGVFTLEPVAKREPVWIAARAEGLHPVAVRETFRADQDGVVIRVGGGGTLEGRVTQADGTPASDREVWLVRPGAPLPPRQEGGMWFMPGGHVELFRFYYTQVRTDADGRYVFRGVPLDEDRLPVVRLSLDADVPGEPLRFAHDGATLVRDIRIPRPASLTVRVFDTEGAIVPDGQVDLESPRIWFHADEDTQRRPDGSVRVEGLVPGPWKVRAWIAGAGHVEREVALSEGADETVEIRAGTGLVLEGQVVDARALPVAGARVWWSGPAHRSTHADDEGRFRFTGLPDAPGTLEVSAKVGFDPRSRIRSGSGAIARDRPLAAVTLENVRPGEEPLHVVLPDGGLIRGRFRGVDPGVRLRRLLLTPKLTSHGAYAAPGDGLYEMASPEPGLPFLLMFGAPDGRLWVREVEALDVGEDLDLGDIVLAPGLDLDGVVLDEGGRPVEGARVRLTQEYGDREAHTDGRGAFRFTGLPPLRHFTRVDTPGYPPAFRVLDPRAGGTQEIRLAKGGILELRVLDADGAPVGQGSFSIRWDHETRYGTDGDGLFDVYRLDPSGTTRFRREAARYRVNVYDEAYEQQAEAAVEIREGETNVVEVRLRRVAVSSPR